MSHISKFKTSPTFKWKVYLEILKTLWFTASVTDTVHVSCVNTNWEWNHTSNDPFTLCDFGLYQTECGEIFGCGDKSACGLFRASAANWDTTWNGVRIHWQAGVMLLPKENMDSSNSLWKSGIYVVFSPTTTGGQGSFFFKLVNRFPTFSKHKSDAAEWSNLMKCLLFSV